LRYRGLALLVLTLSTTIMLQQLGNLFRDFTGGYDGIPGVNIAPLFGLFDYDLYGHTYYLYCLAVLLIAFYGVRRIVYSPFGQSLVGIRENVGRMHALGSPVHWRLVVAYAISAGIAGIAGALFAQTNSLVTLGVFDFDQSAAVLMMLILGGAGWLYGAFVGFACRGEMIPNKDSYCEIDNNVVDEWGIPVLKFHFKWSDDEILMAKHAQETFREIIVTAGGEVVYSSGTDQQWGISKGGQIIHEVGTTQMGDDRRKSVLNEYCQTWDCKNLFVTDGAPFVSNADKNPTLSIMALAWRTSEHIAEEVKKRNV
jgi:choline dehydrogenase-like flavoprotein